MTSQPEITIDGRPIGAAHPPYIIAELSGNHNGDINRAFALIEAAKAAGADAVKLQTYTADTITLDHDGPGFLLTDGLWAGQTLYQLYQEASTPWDWHEALFNKAREVGITCFSTPFDPTAVTLLENLGAPAYKIASFEIVDIALIKRVAAAGKPVIMSTGMASIEEIGEAVEAVRSTGSGEIALLQCTSGYPTPPKDSNLLKIPDLAKRFGGVIGLSDHTMGTAVPVAAIALGATLVEKHFTLRRSDGGVDSAFSLEPEELERLCTDSRIAWTALGRANYERTPSEAPSESARRSLYAVADIAEGEELTERNVRSIRPAFGLAPKHLPKVLGRRAVHAIARGTPLDWPSIE